MLVRIGEDVFDFLLRLAFHTGLLLVGRAESSLGMGRGLGCRLGPLDLHAILVVAAVSAVNDLGAALALVSSRLKAAVTSLSLGLALGRGLLGGGIGSSRGRCVTSLDGQLKTTVALRDRAWGGAASLSDALPIEFLQDNVSMVYNTIFAESSRPTHLLTHIGVFQHEPQQLLSGAWQVLTLLDGLLEAAPALRRRALLQIELFADRFPLYLGRC